MSGARVRGVIIQGGGACVIVAAVRAAGGLGLRWDLSWAAEEEVVPGVCSKSCACAGSLREAWVSGSVRHLRSGPSGSDRGLVELGCRAGLGAKMEFDDGVVDCHVRMFLFGVRGAQFLQMVPLQYAPLEVKPFSSFLLFFVTHAFLLSELASSNEDCHD